MASKKTAKPPTPTLTEQCADSIHKMLVAGKLKNRLGFINERELREQLQVSRVTMRRALALLQADNLLISVPYRGYIAGPSVHIEASIGRPANAKTILWVYQPVHAQRDTINDKSIFDAADSEAKLNGLRLEACRQPLKQLLNVLSAQQDELYGIVLDWQDREVAETLLLKGVPIIQAEGVHEDMGIDSVVQADRRGIERAVEKLWEEGHRRIGLVVWAIPAIQPVRRRSSFITCLLQRGLIDMGLIGASGRFDAAGGSECVARLFNRKNPPSALVVCHPEMLQGVCDELARRNLKPGKDIKLIVWGNPSTINHWLKGSAWKEIPMDLLYWSREEMGKLIIRTLMARHMDPTMPPLRIEVPVQLLPSKETLSS